MKNFWVKGVLEKSLHEQVLITLGMEERPDVVERPWNLIVETEGSERELPANTSILSVFDELGAGRTLLILGEPGSGKTITLLQLARDLLARAEQDVDHLIPVVLNLSSWAPTRRQGRQPVTQSITDWVVEELSSKYQVPRSLGKDWVQKQQLLLLLDGLDEVNAANRNACVKALNDFQQEAGTELVICCRVKDYKALSNRLRVQQAIYIQALILPQVKGYLNSLDANLGGLNSLLARDAALQELAQSPLWLNIMVFVYEGVDTVNLPEMQDIKERQKNLFDQYVDRMFTKSRLFAYVREQKKEKPDRYSRQETMPWLKWLAQQMVQEFQTVFLIERLQLSWLPPEEQRLYRVGTFLLVVLVWGLIVGLIVGLSFGLSFGLIGGLSFGLSFGLIGGLSEEIMTIEELRWSWKKARMGEIVGLSFG